MLRSGISKTRPVDVQWDTDFFQWKSYMGGHPSAMPSDTVVLASGVDGRYSGCIRRYPGHLLLEDMRRLPMLGDLYDAESTAADLRSSLDLPTWFRDDTVTIGSLSWKHLAYVVSAIRASNPNVDTIAQVLPFTMNIKSQDSTTKAVSGFVIRLHTYALSYAIPDESNTTDYAGDIDPDNGLTNWSRTTENEPDYFVAVLLYVPSTDGEYTEWSNFRLVVPLTPVYAEHALPDTEAVSGLPLCRRAMWVQLPHYADNAPLTHPTDDWPWMTFYEQTAVVSSTAQAGGASTITLNAGDTAADDYYNGMRIAITSGIGSGQVRYISDYVSSSKVATVSEAWSTPPAASSGYSIFPVPSRSSLVYANEPVTISCDGRFLNIFSTTGEFKPLTVWFDDQYYGCPDPTKVTGVGLNPTTGGTTPYTYADIDDPRYCWMTAPRAYGWHWESHGFPCYLWNPLAKTAVHTLTGATRAGYATSSKQYTTAYRFWDAYRNRYSSVSAPASIVLGGSDNSFYSLLPIAPYEWDKWAALEDATETQQIVRARNHRLLLFPYYQLYTTFGGGGTLYQTGTYGLVWSATQLETHWDSHTAKTFGEPLWRSQAITLHRKNLNTTTESSTTQAGSTGTTIVLNASASSVNGYYVGAWVTWNSQARRITAYVGSSRTATVSAWTGTPGAGEAYSVTWNFSTYSYLYGAFEAAAPWKDQESAGNDINYWDYLPCTETYLATQPEYDPLTDDLHMPPYKVGAAAFFSRMGVVASKQVLWLEPVSDTDNYYMNQLQYTDSGNYMLHWTDIGVRETYPIDRSYQTEHPTTDPIQIIPIGGSVWVFGGGPTLRGIFSSGTLLWQKVGSAFRIPSSTSVCEAHGSLFVVAKDGAYFIEPNSGVPTPVTAMERILRDHWSDLSEISVAYDSRLDAIYVNNPVYQSTAILWLKNQVVTVLEGHIFNWATSIQLNGEQRVVLCTENGRFCYPKADLTDDTIEPMHGRTYSTVEAAWQYVQVDGTPATVTSPYAETWTRVPILLSKEDSLLRDHEGPAVWYNDGTLDADYYYNGIPIYGVDRNNWSDRYVIMATGIQDGDNRYLYVSGDQTANIADGDWLAIDPGVFHVVLGALETGDTSSTFLKRNVLNVAAGIVRLSGQTLSGSLADYPMFEVGVSKLPSLEACQPQVAPNGFFRTLTSATELDHARLVPDSGTTFSVEDPSTLITAWPYGISGTIMFPYVRTCLPTVDFDLRELSVGGNIYATENVRGV